MQNNNQQLQEFKFENENFRTVIAAIEKNYESTLRNISHEFGNAVTLINSSLQIIESSHPEVKSFKYWNNTMDDVAYLKHLISEISTFNNSEKLKLSPVNLSDIAKSTIDSFSVIPEINTSDISILLTCENDIPDIMGDYTKLKQVFINLLKNAVDACGTSGCITISISAEQDYIVTTLSDTGCGMTPEQLENIFLPLITYKKGGTGLGLSISKRIIRAHNGTISVSSEPGCGSVFTVMLPL